jgi:hypothetical protein
VTVFAPKKEQMKFNDQISTVHVIGRFVGSGLVKDFGEEKNTFRMLAFIHIIAA